MISVVIPVFNERDSLPALAAEIAAVANAARLDLEILFVDDGSTDGSWQAIAELARRIRRYTASAFAAISARRRHCRPASAPHAATSS